MIDDVELREPIGARHPLRIAEAVARLGGRPAGPLDDYEDAVLACSAPTQASRVAPHDDPDPARRAARRILQRLDGMGKWGGYHTEFAHLPRGFAGNDRALAQEVGEALLEAGLLAEKPSVGQRHVYLNPRRAAEIRRLIETGEAPTGYAAAVQIGEFRMPIPRLATEVQTKLHTLVTLTRAGIVHPERPDHLWHTARALLRYGTTPAAGYTRGGAQPPGRAGGHRRARHAQLQGGRRAHERARARARGGRDRRGRRRRDHVPQPPRLDRLRRRLLEARAPTRCS